MDCLLMWQMNSFCGTMQPGISWNMLICDQRISYFCGLHVLSRWRIKKIGPNMDFQNHGFYCLHMALISFLIKTKDLVVLITFYSKSSRRSFISGLTNKYQALGKVKFWHIFINGHSINNFWHILSPSQNIYKHCFSPVIQALHLSKANWLNYLPLPYFPLLHTHTHCTLSKDLLFFCSFSEFICLDSDAPAGLEKKCNTNKL